MQGGRRRHPGKFNWRRIGLFLVAFVTVCAVTATVTAAALVWYGEQQIAEVNVETQLPGDTDGDGSIDIPELQNVRNVLIVGSDSREGLSRKERSRLGTGQFSGTRTDTIMLIQLDPKRRGAAMMSFPRDLLVERCDGTQGRINSAFEIGASSDVGGPTCLVRTVSQLTNIPIHHYAQIDFAGFVDVVDTLGGVKLFLQEPIKDPDAHVDLPAGCVTMNGKEALGFVRVRKIDSDFGRIARQQRFLREVIDQVTSAGVALNVPKLFRLVEVGARSLDTDPSLSLSVMRQIAFSFRDIKSESIDTRTVPGFNRVISGAAYVVVDEEPAEALFAAFREGVAAPENVGKKAPGDVKVADVPPLEILNGTPMEGLAATAAKALEARGFEVAGTGNADKEAPRTRIIHPPRRAEEARLVRELFPRAVLVPDDGASGLRVELGADTNRDRLLAVQATPTGAPEPEEQPTFKGAEPAPKQNC